MKEIRKVLATVDYPPKEMEQLRMLFPNSKFVHVNHRDSDAVRQEVIDSDVAIIPSDVDVRFMGENSLRWIHCDHAGLNRSATPDFFKKGILLSGSAGRSSPVLAEHCIYFMLQACYHTRELLRAQDACHWGVQGQDTWRGLFGRTAGIIGMGNNGRMLAERLHAFGMDLITYDRYPVEGYDFIRKKLCQSEGDSLRTLLEESDFIILCVALTDETYHMIDRQAFAAMKKGVTLVNMARGALICTQDLLEALDDGTVGCAGLDVFEQEPLPKEHPLWRYPQVYITPHVTPQVPSRAGRSLAIIAENVRRYQHDQPLLNQVTEKDICSR